MSLKQHDIAVIGMACRFPGAENYYEYWHNLVNGIDSVTEVPSDRWRWQDYLGDPTKGNFTTSKWGGFVKDADKFDSLFFKISPREAGFIDPQHRVFLEEVWHAVEDAGHKISDWSGHKIGVYAGVSKNDYAELMREEKIEISSYVSTGTVHSILANRVSFLFNFRGKSEPVDTACSSSLVALHNAMRDIASGETDIAIVGGVNLLLSPTIYISHGKSGMLSPDGKCKTFDAAANGYVRGEGVGVLVVRSLKSALENKDNIHAIIKGSAINHGGRAMFLTSPNVTAQAEVIQQAHLNSGVLPESISYVEAHGTGTEVGDPIEINALKHAFSRPEQSIVQKSCVIGSVKTNIGHLEAAAGMAGLIKVILSMKFNLIPKLLNFNKLNPLINIENSPFCIASESLKWDDFCKSANQKLKRGSVSSFGMGGVNAHVILEEFKPVEYRDNITDSPAVALLTPIVFVFSSAKNRIHFVLDAFVKSLTQVPNKKLESREYSQHVAFTLFWGREILNERVAFVAENIDQLLKLIKNNYTHNETDSVIHSSIGNDRCDPKIISAAKYWCAGKENELVKLGGFSEGRRISLPGYPFQKTHIWYPANKISALKNMAIEKTRDNSNTNAAPVKTIPLPTAENDVTEKILDPFRLYNTIISDHVVDGQAILPGASYLGWIVEEKLKEDDGLENAAIEITDVYWISKCGLYDSLHLNLEPKGGCTEFSFSSTERKYSIGKIRKVPTWIEPPTSQELGSRLSTSYSKQHLYTLFNKYGLSYGPLFQVLQYANIFEHEARSSYKINSDSPCADFFLNPAIVDACFQTVVAFCVIGLNRLSQEVPYCLDKLTILKTLPNEGNIVVIPEFIRSDHVKFNISIFDLAGQRVANFEGFSKRSLHGSRPQTSKIVQEEIFFSSTWADYSFTPSKQKLIPANTIFINAPRQVVDGVVGGIHFLDIQSNCENDAFRSTATRCCTSQSDVVQRVGDLFSINKISTVVLFSNGQKVNQDQAAGAELADAINLLWLTQAIMKTRNYKNIKLLSAVCDNYLMGGFHVGFYRTLRYENPNIKCAVVYLNKSSEIAIVNQLLHSDYLWDHDAVSEIDYRGSLPKCKQNIALGKVDFGEPTYFKKGMTVVISGGAGGLGFIFSQQLATTFNANIVWIGRSEVNEAVTQKINTIKSIGVDCLYFQANICEIEAVEKVWDTIKGYFPRIDGIIHAAGVIDDSYIFRKTTESFTRVISTKILGAKNLDEVSKGERLAFFILFSSIAAKMPNQGQCDYAAANNYLDCFAETRNDLVSAGVRNGKTLSINWPLWAEGGMGVSKAEKEHLQQVFGMEPLPTAKGVDSFLTCTQITSFSHVLVIDGDHSKIAKHLHLQITQPAPTQNAPIIVSDSSSLTKSQIERAVISIVEAYAGIDARVSLDEPIAQLNLDSMALHNISAELCRKLAVVIEVTFFFEAKSLRDIVDKIIFSNTAHGNYSALQAPINAVIKIESEEKMYSLIDIQASSLEKLEFIKKFSVTEFYLRDHVVNDLYNMPGACYIEMARQAGEIICDANQSVLKLTNNYWIKQLSSKEDDFNAIVKLIKKNETTFNYEIYSNDKFDGKVQHATGTIILGKYDLNEAGQTIDLHSLPELSSELKPYKIYQSIISEGLHVGETFMPMQSIKVSATNALAHLILPISIEETINEYLLHPTLLTGVFQTALICNRQVDKKSNRFIPIAIDEINVYKKWDKECYVYCQAQAMNTKQLGIRKFNLDVLNRDGSIVANLNGFTIKELGMATQEKNHHKNVNFSQKNNYEPSIMRQHQNIENLVKEIFSEALGIRAEEIGNQTPFEAFEITPGVMAEMNRMLGLHYSGLSKTLIFEYGNLDELVEFLLNESFISKIDESNKNDSGTFINNEMSLQKKLIAKLKSIIAEPLEMAEHDIDEDEQFESYGINSIVIQEVNVKLEGVFGPLSKTLLFEYRSLNELADYLLENSIDAIHILFPLTEKNSAAAPSKSAVDSINLLRPAPAAPIGDIDSLQLLDDPIAIIGLAGRYPGAENIDAFWENLREGRDCITEAPVNRNLLLSNLYNENPKENLIYSKWGGFLNEISLFDAELFGISPREAELIDPQERLMLEVAWEALMDAGYSKARLAGYKDDTSVYVGAIWQPYSLLGAEQTAMGNPVAPSGLLYSIANRISFTFDLKGPSMTVDTACSGSLTALHLACQSLRTGESKIAIVGGVNISLHSSKYLFLSQNRFLSTDGKCRSFGAGGDGYVPGEGVGSVILKPLSLAKKDGDQIYGLILGTAVNHGGRTNGYTVPDPKAQAQVIAKVFQQAKISPDSVSYVEAHGTGTSLGDPIEIAGLERVFSANSVRAARCKIGSVKSNIGHLEAAAGIAGLSKILLQYRHRLLVPSLHSEQLNPNIQFEKSCFSVQQRAELLSEKEVLRSGISSFGAGGSNAHAIIESFAYPASNNDNFSPYWIPLSARTSDDLTIYAHALCRTLMANQNDSLTLENVAFTLCEGRDSFHSRAAFVVNSIDSLKTLLENFSTAAADKVIVDPMVDPGTARLMLEEAGNWVNTGRRSEKARSDYSRIVSLNYPPFHHAHYWLSPIASATSTEINVHSENISQSDEAPGLIPKKLAENINQLDSIYFYDSNLYRLDQIKRQLGFSQRTPVSLYSTQSTRVLGSMVGKLDLTSRPDVDSFFHITSLRLLAVPSNFVLNLSQYKFNDIYNILGNVISSFKQANIRSRLLLIFSADENQDKITRSIEQYFNKFSFSHHSIGCLFLDDAALDSVFFGAIIEQELAAANKYWLSLYKMGVRYERHLSFSVATSPHDAGQGEDIDSDDFIRFLLNNEIDPDLLFESIVTSEIQ